MVRYFVEAWSRLTAHGISYRELKRDTTMRVEVTYIEGFKAVLNPVKMGLDHVAFAEVKLTNTHEDALRAFNEAVKKIPEVEECHMIAGRFDYLLKIRTRDIRRYRHVLGERISELPFVASTSTNVTMETVVDNWSARHRTT